MTKSSLDQLLVSLHDDIQRRRETVRTSFRSPRYQGECERIGVARPAEQVGAQTLLRRVTYALADPRYVATVAAGREPTYDDWRDWTSIVRR